MFIYPRTLALSAALCSLLLAGCSTAANNTPAAVSTQATLVTGNWQISSTATQAQTLPMISGSLAGTSTAITGIFHAQGDKSCVSSLVAIPVSGAADSKGNVTLTSAAFGGSTLTITGQLAADGRSLQSAAYKVAGGACAFTATAAPVAATAQQFAPIDGNYTGSFTSTDGDILSVSAALTQTPSSDTTGNFQLSGTGNFGTNPCIASPATVTNSQVTGGTVNITYTDSSTQNQVVASGTFSQDGKSLAVTNWTLTGTCGTVTGTGSLSRP